MPGCRRAPAAPVAPPTSCPPSSWAWGCCASWSRRSPWPPNPPQETGFASAPARWVSAALLLAGAVVVTHGRAARPARCRRAAPRRRPGTGRGRRAHRAARALRRAGRRAGCARDGPRRRRAGSGVGRRRGHRPGRAHRDGLPGRRRHRARGRGAARLVARGVGGPAGRAGAGGRAGPAERQPGRRPHPAGRHGPPLEHDLGGAGAARRSPPPGDRRRRARPGRAGAGRGLGRHLLPRPRRRARRVGGRALPAQSEIAPWARWALPAVAAVALGYQARSVRDRVARFAMLAACRLARRRHRLRRADRPPVVGARPRGGRARWPPPPPWSAPWR